MNITLRSETSKDYNGIARVNDLAFKRTAESKLIEELRKAKDFNKNLSIVALVDNEIVGHTLFTPVEIDDNGQVTNSLTLAPMSVLPDFQKKSVGKLMITYGLQAAKDAGFESVVVLGHQSYYPKFGFKKASGWQLTSPFPAPDEAFMAIELISGALDKVKGKVIFPDAFQKV